MNLDLVTIVVDEYDPAIAFFTDALGFDLVADLPSTTDDGRPKRWVVVRPPGGRIPGRRQQPMGSAGPARLILRGRLDVHTVRYPVGGRRGSPDREGAVVGAVSPLLGARWNNRAHERRRHVHGPGVGTHRRLA